MAHEAHDGLEDMSDNRDIERFNARVEAERLRIRDYEDRVGAQLTTILLTGSLGVVAASVAFMKDIAPHPRTGSLCFVRLAWVLLVASSGLAIASLFSSRTAGTHYRNLLHARTQNEDETRAKAGCERWNGVTKALQLIGLIGLAGGVIALMWFANLNLPHEVP